MKKIFKVVSSIRDNFIKKSDIQLVWADDIKDAVSFRYSEAASDDKLTNKQDSKEAEKEVCRKDIQQINSRSKHGYKETSADDIKMEIVKVYTKCDINGRQMAMGYLIRNTSNMNIKTYGYEYIDKVISRVSNIKPGETGILNDVEIEKFVRANGLFDRLRTEGKIELGKAYLTYREDIEEVVLNIPKENRGQLIEILVSCDKDGYKITNRALLKKEFGNEFENVERDRQYKVIGKLKCENNDLKYILLSIEGENTVVTKLELLRICREGNIRNCRVIEEKSGKYRFVGVGMSFESLPEIEEKDYYKLKLKLINKEQDKEVFKKAGLRAESKVAVSNFMTNYYKEKYGISIEVANKGKSEEET